MSLLLAVALVTTSAETSVPVFEEPRLEIGLAAGAEHGYGSFYDGDFSDGPVFRISGGFRPLPSVLLEASWFGGSVSVRGTSHSATFEAASVDARVLVPLALDWKATAFLGFAPGFNASVGPLSLRGFSTELGAGVRRPFAWNWEFGIDARWSFVRYLRGYLNGDASGLVRQRHGDLGALTVGVFKRF